MKICFIANSYPTMPKFGGIAAYTRTAAQGLAGRGHEVHVLVARPGEHLDCMDGAVHLHFRPVRWMPVVGKWLVGLGESFCVGWWLRQLHRQVGFNIVEFPNWEGIGLISEMFRIAPILVRLHTSTADSIQAAKRAPKRGEPFLMWAEDRSTKLAISLVTHSKSHRNSAEEKLKKSLDEIRVIPHGIPIPPNPTPETSLSVLVVGPLNSRKGADTLLAAIPLVLAKVPDAQFILAGPSEDDLWAKRFRSQYPSITHRQVQFRGFVKDEELSRLYAECALYASASRYESFGLTFIEAMACGKPVVGCATSAMEEIIKHESTGLLVPPSDPEAFAGAILRLLQDRSLRSQLGNNARISTEETYSASRMAANIEDYYQSVITPRTHAL